MKRGVLKAIFLASTLFILGCNSGGEKSKNVEKKEEKEITFLIPDWGNPPEKMLEEFEKESGIKVKVESMSWDDIREKIAISSNAKNAVADVIEVDWSWIGEFEKANWLEPLKIKKEDIKDIPSIATYEKNGKILALPYANGFRLGFYNKNIYESAGLKEPITWDDVTENMKTIKEKGILEYPFTFPLNANEGTTTSFVWLTFMREGKVFNGDNTLNKENALKSLKYIKNMIDNGLINPANLSMSALDTYREILSKDAAFMVGPTTFVARVENPKQSKVIGEIGVILPPGGKGKAKHTVPQTEAVGISIYSKNKESAEKFVKWYTSKETQIKLYDELNIFPTRLSVLNSLIKNGKIKNPGALEEAAKIVKSPYPNGVPSYYSEMSSIIYNTVNKMASGNISPEDAAEEMDLGIKKLIKENRE